MLVKFASVFRIYSHPAVPLFLQNKFVLFVTFFWELHLKLYTFL